MWLILQCDWRKYNIITTANLPVTLMIPWPHSVSIRMGKLGWQKLADHMYILCLLFKIVHNQICIPVNNILPEAPIKKPYHERNSFNLTCD